MKYNLTSSQLVHTWQIHSLTSNLYCRVRLTKTSETSNIELLANGLAIADRRVNDDGGTSAVVIGWQPAKKALVETGYSSYGVTWTVHYDAITNDTLSGKVVFGLPDESSSAGEITIRKKSNDAYSYEWYAKKSGEVTAKGEATITRKAE